MEMAVPASPSADFPMKLLRDKSLFFIRI